MPVTFKLPPRVLILQTGTDGPELRQLHQENVDWFAHCLRPLGVETVVGKAFDGSALPPSDGFDGILVTGSPAFVTEQALWMVQAGAYLKSAAQNVPVLGVCFGQQLLGDALGGVVRDNPKGAEGGTVTVELTEAGQQDPLFAGLPHRLDVQQSHFQHVEVPPKNAVVLAGNDHTPVQAFAVGDNIRAVQFHPEMTAQIQRNYINAQKGDKAPDTIESALAGIRDTPLAKKILQNWVEHFVERDIRAGA